jgi:hypothetical protein
MKCAEAYVSHPFSTKGTIGRFAFLCYFLLFILSPFFGMFAWLVMWLLPAPVSVFWGERSADFVRDHLSWITDGWGAVIVVIGFYLLGQRLFDCAYIKRARATGVEIESAWVVQLYFLGFEPGATFKDLVFPARSRHGRQISRDGAPSS